MDLKTLSWRYCNFWLLLSHFSLVLLEKTLNWDGRTVMCQTLDQSHHTASHSLGLNLLHRITWLFLHNTLFSIHHCGFWLCFIYGRHNIAWFDWLSVETPLVMSDCCSSSSLLFFVAQSPLCRWDSIWPFILEWSGFSEESVPMIDFLSVSPFAVVSSVPSSLLVCSSEALLSLVDSEFSSLAFSASSAAFLSVCSPFAVVSSVPSSLLVLQLWALLSLVESEVLKFLAFSASSAAFLSFSFSLNSRILVLKQQ